MKIKIISVFLVVLILLSAAAPAVFAEGGFVLTLDEDERFTDIIEASDNQEKTYFDIEKSSAAMTKTTYVIILSVLLAISVVVLAVTLHKQKKLNAEDDENTDSSASSEDDESKNQ